MKQTLNTLSRIALVVAALALITVPATALEPVIEHGSDIWHTQPNGTSVVKFEADPLPADFFCTGSKPFAGRIVVGGVPLATEPAGVLGRTDTIVQRLDNAVFDDNGVAQSRIQVSAIHLRSVQPFQTSCGAFDLDVTLADGEQPVGEMRIVRQGANFGYYEADVALNVQLTFTPAEGDGPALEVVRHVDFPANRNFWAERPGEGGVQYHGFVMVDTDSNGEADTFVPGTSRNFAPGWFGGRTDRGLLHREALSQSRPEISGSLKATGPIPMTSELGLRQVGAGLEDTTKSLSTSIDCTADNCHCEDDGDHCQDPVLKESTTLEAQ